MHHKHVYAIQKNGRYMYTMLYLLRHHLSFDNNFNYCIVFFLQKDVFLIFTTVLVFIHICMSARKRNKCTLYNNNLIYTTVLYENIDQILPNKLHGPTHYKNRCYMCIPWTQYNDVNTCFFTDTYHVLDVSLPSFDKLNTTQ